MTSNNYSNYRLVLQFFLLLISDLWLAHVGAASSSYCVTDSTATPALSGGLNSAALAAMTVEVCYTWCIRNGYLWAGMKAGNLCVCGNSVNSKATSVVLSICNTPCTYWKFQRILRGSGSYMSLYRTSVALVNGICASDSDASPTLTNNTQISLYGMTVEYCKSYCQVNGYAIAGLEYGYTCMCGNTLASTAAVSSNCNTPCDGNSNEKCGGSPSATVAINLYNIPKQFSSGSCISDNSAARSLNGLSSTSSGLSADECYTLCNRHGFKWAGLEAGNQCFCGNEILNNPLQLTSSSCGIPCPGKSSQFCGGTGAMLIYRTPVTFAEGDCISDTPYRSLSGPSFSIAGLTVEMCKTWCNSGGYTYAGVEVGYQCFCGNSFVNNAVTLPSASCNVSCYGNSAEMCGGNWAMNAYTAAATGSAYINGDCISQGQAKPLNGISVTNNAPGMTVNICFVWCESNGYKWAGLTAGNQCYCGNSIDNNPKVLLPSSCNTPCSGNSSQACGGTGLLNIYNTRVQFSDGYCVYDASPQILNGTRTGSSSMTIDYCKSYCQTRGYIYAGVESGNYCSCGNFLSSNPIPSPSCNTACSGNSNLMCGGSQSLNLYNVPRAFMNADCISDNSAARSLNGINVVSSVMTADVCYSWCGRHGYKWAGLEAGNQCYCGNSIVNNPLQLAPSSCKIPCLGNTSETCGGNGAMSIYRTNIQFVDGDCISDSVSRSLNGTTSQASGLTVEMCKTWCSGQGYTYAGVEVGYQCFCGNSLVNTPVTLPSASCNTPCLGNSAEMCGGIWAMNVYSASSASVIGPTYISADCISTVQGQPLNGISITTGAMTAVNCYVWCASNGYKWAGLQSGNQCYCGNSINNSPATLLPSSCSTVCAGNSTQICGGASSMNIYSISSTSGASPYYQGECLADSAAAPILNGMSVTNVPGMTADSCYFWCDSNGYKWSGVEGGNQCYCGNTVNNNPFPLQAGSSCNIPCAGNSGEFCGGNGAMNIYRTSVQFLDGDCITDSASRVLDGIATEFISMTIQQCTYYCQENGYKYAGMEVGKQCFCGNSFKSNPTPSASCNVPCNGNSNQVCGGSWAMNIYHTSPSETQFFSGDCVYSPGQYSLLNLGNIPNYSANTDNLLSFCISSCANQGYLWAGMMTLSSSFYNLPTCSCGNSMFGKPFRLPQSTCKNYCVGNSCGYYGANQAMTVYRTPAQLKMNGVCITDSFNNRDTSSHSLTGLVTSMDTLGGATVDNCVNYCKNHGYQKAGIEHVFTSNNSPDTTANVYCSCGNSFSNSPSILPTFVCNTVCHDNPSQVCGGNATYQSGGFTSFMSVYSTSSYTGNVNALPAYNVPTLSTYISSVANPNMCMDQTAWLTTAGQQMEIYQCFVYANTNPPQSPANQLYSLTNTGQIQIRGGLCLDVWGRGTAPGTPVMQNTCNQGSNQVWIFNPESQQIVSGMNSGSSLQYCLDISGTIGNGAKLVLNPCSLSPTQQWMWGFVQNAAGI